VLVAARTLEYVNQQPANCLYFITRQSFYKFLIQPVVDYACVLHGPKYDNRQQESLLPIPNRGILADVIVYIFAHLRRALRTEGKVLDIN